MGMRQLLIKYNNYYIFEENYFHLISIYKSRSINNENNWYFNDTYGNFGLNKVKNLPY